MTDDSQAVEPGDVIQLDPEHSRWGPVFVVADEVRTWGVQGYLIGPEDKKIGTVYVRVKHGHYARIGKAQWVYGAGSGEKP
jgi:hypothetical protein